MVSRKLKAVFIEGIKNRASLKIAIAMDCLYIYPSVILDNLNRTRALKLSLEVKI